MPFTGFIVSDDLNMLTRILNEHCLEHGITAAEERDGVAHRIMKLVKDGVTGADELTLALRRAQED